MTPATGAADRVELPGIYMASKAVHGPRWREFRDAGWPIISTWIDEAEAGRTTDWQDLWDRCASEAARAAVTVLYREDGEELKGALVEAGAALSHGRKVIVVGPVPHTWAKHRNAYCAADLSEARELWWPWIVAARIAARQAALKSSSGAGAAGLEELRRLLFVFGDHRFAAGEMVGDTAAYEKELESARNARAALLSAFSTLTATIARQADDLERLRGKVATARAEGLREAAALLAPKGPRPCDCEHCDCGNPGDHAHVVAWDEATASAAIVRAQIARPSADQREGADEGVGRL